MSESPSGRTRPRELELYLTATGIFLVFVLAAVAVNLIWPRIKFERQVRAWSARAGLWHYRAESSDKVNGCVYFEVEGDVITEKGFVLNDRPYFWIAKMRIESSAAARSESVNCFGERMTSTLNVLADGRLENHWQYLGQSWSARAYATRIGPDGASSEGRAVLPDLDAIGRRLATESPEELFGAAGADYWRQWWAEKRADYQPRRR